jgi:predicted nucleic acid-binding protein
MIVLDTTVLVYAKGADHALRDPCRSLLVAIAAGEIQATTSVEAIQEFVHVRARRRSRIDAAALGRDYAQLLAPLLTISARDLRTGLALFEADDRRWSRQIGHSSPSRESRMSFRMPLG